MSETLSMPSVTGIHVDFPIAGPGARSYAFIIDWHIRLLLALAWFIVATTLMTGSFRWINAQDEVFSAFLKLSVVPSVLIYLFYHPVLEVLMRGRTPGKRMAGVRIVTQDGQRPGVGPLLVRNVLRILDSLPTAYVIGLVSTLVTRNAVRIGDLAAGTILVYDGDPAKPGASRLTLDQAAIATHGLDRAELARELLERWNELLPEIRVRLSTKLLAELGAATAGLGEYELKQELQARLG